MKFFDKTKHPRATSKGQIPAGDGKNGSFVVAQQGEPVGGDNALTQVVPLKIPVPAIAPLVKGARMLHSGTHLDANQRQTRANIINAIERANFAYRPEVEGGVTHVQDLTEVRKNQPELLAEVRRNLPNLSPQAFGAHYDAVQDAAQVAKRFEGLEQDADIMDDEDMQFEDYDDWVRGVKGSDYNRTGQGPDPDDAYSEYANDMRDKASDRVNDVISTMIQADAEAWNKPWDQSA